jgi:hypothetical protein
MDKDTRPALDILTDPATPLWMREAAERIRSADPLDFAFLCAMHDIRLGLGIPATGEPA